MHPGQNRRKPKNVNKATKHKLNENRGKFINFAEIGRNFINFVDRRGYAPFG